MRTKSPAPARGVGGQLLSLLGAWRAARARARLREGVGLGNEQSLAIAHEPLGPGPGLDWTGLDGGTWAVLLITMEWVRRAERRTQIAEENWENTVQ